MMLVGLPLLFTSAPVALAAPRSPAAMAAGERRGFRFPPLRFGLGVGMRPGMQSSFVFSMGAQLKRWKRAKLDGFLGLSAGANLWIPGPFRSLIQTDNLYDLLLPVGHRLEVGPTAGVSFRRYRQQWNDVGVAVTPVLGVRANAPLVLSRRFSWALDARCLFDLLPTQLAVEGREIRPVSPLQIQVAMRFNFGHGRPPLGEAS